MKLVTKSLDWFAQHINDSVAWKPELLALVTKLKEHEAEEPFVCGEKLSEKVIGTLKERVPELERKLYEQQSKVKEF
jgi:hypothetical protein